MMSLKAPRGTKDILPIDVSLWISAECKAREIFKLYGYEEIRTPIFEEAELFNRSLGETSEVVQKQLLTLSEERSKALALRPEATASVVRAYIEHNLDKKDGFVKLCYIGPMFRGERPQKGRLRQFNHIGAEAIGASNPYLDVEIISLAIEILRGLGIVEFVLKINNLGCDKDREKVISLFKHSLESHVSQLCENCQDRFDRNALRIFDCKNESCINEVKNLQLDNKDWLCPECRDYFHEVQEGLRMLEIPFKLTHCLVRGLDYYTKTVFEIVHNKLGSQDAVGAGGRYDNLVNQLGGPRVGAVGFALGLERVMLAMPEKNAIAKSIDFFIAVLGKEARAYATKILYNMRKNGITADIDYEATSLKSQMRKAGKLNSRFVGIVGEDEIKKKAITVKDMTSSSQEEISVDDLLDYIKRRS